VIAPPSLEKASDSPTVEHRRDAHGPAASLRWNREAHRNSTCTVLCRFASSRAFFTAIARTVDLAVFDDGPATPASGPAASQITPIAIGLSAAAKAAAGHRELGEV